MSAHFGSRMDKFRTPTFESELKKLKVTIRRTGIVATGPTLPLERDIDDPTDVCSHVHVRKGKPPSVPVFGRDIKVNQDFSEDRHVFTDGKNTRSSRRSRSVSRLRSDRYRSRSKDRPHYESKRNKSRSRDRSRRSKDRSSRRSNSSGRSPNRCRSEGRERRYSFERRRYRDDSRERYKRSRSRSSLRHHGHEPDCPMYKSPTRRKRRSITPLRPGEYRPGHPDLHLRNATRKSRSRSRSPRSLSREEINLPSTSRERGSPGRSRSSRRSSPPRERRRSRPRHRSPIMPMPGMEYGFYDGFAPLPMHPVRGRVPLIQPGFYPRMFPPNLLMPRMPLNPMMPGMPRFRWPIYNSRPDKINTPKPATITSKEKENEGIVEHPVEVTQNPTDSVSSSDKLLEPGEAEKST